MIILKVENYCHGCEFFEATNSRPSVVYCDGQPIIVGDMTITCKNKAKCAYLYKYWKENVKEETNE